MNVRLFVTLFFCALVSRKQTFVFAVIVAHCLRLINEALWDFVPNGRKALGTENVVLHAVAMEDVRGVTVELDNFLFDFTIAHSKRPALIKSAFKLICLHLELVKGLAADLACLVLVNHQGLGDFDDYRVLQLTLADSLYDELDQSGNGEAFLHFLRGVDDSLPERVQHQNEKNRLDDANENEPVDEQDSAHDNLKHHRVKLHLVQHRWVCHYDVAFTGRVACLEEYRISVEEPDGEEEDLEDGDEKCVVEIEVVSQAAKDRHSEEAQD